MSSSIDNKWSHYIYKVKRELLPNRIPILLPDFHVKILQRPTIKYIIKFYTEPRVRLYYINCPLCQENTSHISYRTNIDQHLAHTIVITSLYLQLPQTSLNANQLQAIPELTPQDKGKLVKSLTGLIEITLNTIYNQLKEHFQHPIIYYVVENKTGWCDTRGDSKWSKGGLKTLSRQKAQIILILNFST